MNLKLNISKNGLSTTEEVINEEYTLRYGHVFRGKSAYEYAIESGLFSGTEEEFAAYLGNIKDETNAAKKAAASARDAAVLAGLSTQSADDAAREALTEADNAKKAAASARDAAVLAGLSTQSADDAAREALTEADNANKAAASARDAAERANKAAEKAELSIIEIDTELSETSNNAIANSAVAKALKTKQDTLTLTTKPNGNIIIGNLAGQSKEFMPATPSGDPMHYAYLKVYGLSYDETTGLWAYRADEGGLTDLTTEEVQNMWLVAGGLDEKSSNYCRWAKKIDNLFPARTNICSTYYGKGQGYVDSVWDFAFNQNQTIEVAVITHQPDTTEALAAQPVFCAGMFAYCYKLRKIIGGLSFLYIYKNDSRYTNMFTQCPLLESVKIWKLDRNLGFPHSSFFSKESLLFMINNCASGVSFTITLHPDVYAKCTDADNGEWYDDVVNAIDTAMNSKNTTITLASA